MSTPNPITDEARAKGRELAQQLKDDPAFRQQVEADPHGVLREAGVPDEAVLDFMREAGLEADVAGYQGCIGTCYGKTCIITSWE